MRKFLVLIVCLLLGTALQAQSVWYQSSKCYIGAKKAYESEYIWSDPYVSKINIEIRKNSIMVLAENSFIVHTHQLLQETEGFLMYSGVDDEGDKCIVKIGAMNNSPNLYISFEYANVAFFYVITIL